jgi:transglutaminase-like putative cysteine protease
MYMGDEVQAFGGHAWNEVAIDGSWIPVDPTWNQVQVDATHIKIGHGDEGETAHLWVLGRLAFRLVSVERKP